MLEPRAAGFGNSSLPDTLDQARASRHEPIPVLLIDAVSPIEVPFATEAIRTMRMNNRPGDRGRVTSSRGEWLATIPGSRLIVTNRSGHNVAQEQPELVIDTIRQAVKETR